MPIYDTIVVGGAIISGVNTALIIHLIRNRDSQIERLLQALLHTRGETQAASAIRQPTAAEKKAAAERLLPQHRTRQVGMTPR